MQSEAINELMAALAKAQATIKNAVINRENPHFRSKYADLASCFDAVRKPLGENGLIVTQTTEIREQGFVLVTMLAHASGQWVKSEYPLPSTGRPQELGSALTYARRYSLSAITGIAADDDDDAEAAEAKRQTTDARHLAPPSPGAPEAPAPAPPEPPVNPETGEVSPHAIAYDGKAIPWGSLFVAAVKSSTLATDLIEWQTVNGETLRKIATEAPKVYARIQAAFTTRFNELGRGDSGSAA